MHTYNTRHNPHYVVPTEEVPDVVLEDIAEPSTNQGGGVRWRCSEEPEVKVEEDDSEYSPSEYSEESSSSSSGDTELVDNDGDSRMGDDTDARFVTPQREIPYRPGSVADTPRPGRILRHEPRAEGGFNFWHERDGAVMRLSFGRDGLLGGATAGAEGQQLPLDHPQVLEACEDVRRSVSPAVSVASDATVIIDPRATPQPTLSNGAMPLVRHPTWPEGFDPNAPGPSRGRTNRLSTIREGSEEVQWPPRIPIQHPGMRIRRNDEGLWVREGSLDPEAAYEISAADLPPRIDRVQAPAQRRAARPAGHPRVNRAEVVITTKPPHHKR
ncbi:hypothetical protein VTO73DRAFT_11186 [Trametes versicolor]